MNDSMNEQAPGNVPVVLQENSLECGVACLAMVCGAYGLRVSVADCRRVLPISERGVNAHALREAARTFGLEAKVWSAPDRAALEELSLPAIVHLGEKHFAVVEAWTPDEVRLVDPAQGRRRLAWSEFLELHSGAAMNFSPSRAATTPPPGPRGFQRFRLAAARSLAVPGARSLALSWLLGTIPLYALALGLPWAGMLVIDRFRPNAFSTEAALGLLGAVFLFALLAALRSIHRLHFGERLARQLAAEEYREIFGISEVFSDPKIVDPATAYLLVRLRRNVADRAVALWTEGLWIFLPLLAAAVLEARIFLGTIATIALYLLLGAGESKGLRQLREGTPTKKVAVIEALQLHEWTAPQADLLFDPSTWRFSGRDALRFLLSWISTAVILALGLRIASEAGASPGAVASACIFHFQAFTACRKIEANRKRLKILGPRLEALAVALRAT